MRKLKSVSFTLSRLLDGTLELLSSVGVMTLLPAGPSLAFWRTHTHIHTQKQESKKRSPFLGRMGEGQNWRRPDLRWHSQERGCTTTSAQTQLQRLIPTTLLMLLSELKWKTVFRYNQIKAVIWLEEQNQSKKQSQSNNQKITYFHAKSRFISCFCFEIQ